ncbi:MAG: hypothetical protein ACOH2G_04245 [Ewingella sp.]
MAAAKTDYVKLEYQILDLVEYNGLKITGNMKILLSLIYSYERTRRTYYESVPTLGKRLGLEPQATRSLIAKLCTAGMISYDERRGSSHIFHSKLLNQELMILIGEEKPKKNSKPVSKKTEDKQENGKSEQAKPQAEQGKRTDQVAGMAAGSAPDASEQRSGVAANDDNGCNDRDGGNFGVKTEEQNYNPDPPFLMPKPASQETAGRVMATLDDLLCWFDLGNGEGMDEYGVMWGVSGDDLDSLIGKHLKTREAEAEKNFKSQRAH